MKTTLRASVELSAISVFAEVAVWEKRLELQRLCRLGQASGKIDASVVASALPGLSNSAHRNVLKTIEHMQLIDSMGTMTSFGLKCSQTGEAPAWELGVFTFLVARHGCFGAWPLAFVREKPDGQDRDFNSLDVVPDWFSPMPQHMWTSAFEDKQVFTLSRFPTRNGQNAVCRVKQMPEAVLVWEIDLITGKNLRHVEGSVLGADDKPRSFRSMALAVPDDEVRGYFGTWEPQWNKAVGRVLRRYDGHADKDGRDDFLRTLRYPRVTAGQRGTYENVRVDEVPVGPSGSPEAAEWATALAIARIKVADAIVTPKSWSHTWDTILEAKPLQAGAGPAPEVSTLLDRSPPRLRWLLTAGTDLGME